MDGCITTRFEGNFTVVVLTFVFEYQIWIVCFFYSIIVDRYKKGCFLQEEVYAAYMADLSHSLYVSDKGLTLKVNGYSQNLHVSFLSNMKLKDII